jgi:ABC-type transport system involved in multi-copper enzyme maturation permease subunit
MAVTRHGVRSTIKGKLVKLMLIGAWLPAIVLVTFLALWGLLEQQAESILTFMRNILPKEIVTEPQQFRSAIWTIAYSFFFKAQIALSIFLVLVVGPSLVSRDLRFNAFPLYFSRPLTRFDYFVGKLGVIGFFLLLTAVGPALVAYIFGLAFSLDLSIIRDTHRLLWGSVLYGLVITVSAGTLMLALSSLSRRSIYVGLAWGGFCFLTLSLSGMLLGLQIAVNDRMQVEEVVSKWVEENPPPPGIKVEGRYSITRTSKSKEEIDAQEKWLRQRRELRNRLNNEFHQNIAVKMNNDWRRVVAYNSNLERVGDWILVTDSAWVTIGKAIETSRRAMDPLARIGGDAGRALRNMIQPPNYRLLADQWVLQYPVTWSVAVLGGLWLLSVFILTTRVKSLDRLK